MKKTIIVDIDNTIVDQVPRKKEILKILKMTDTDEKVLREDFDLHSILHGTNRAAFMKFFLGPERQECLTAISSSVEALNRLKNDYHILYLSSRPKVQEEITIQLLKRLGFPEPDGDEIQIVLWPAEYDIGEFTEDDINSRSLEWKRKHISQYASQKPVLAGISDTPQDVSIFANLGIPSILFHSHGEESDLRKNIEEIIRNKFISKSVKFISAWQQIPYIVKTLDKAEKDLADLVRMHTNEYTSFLGDLDAKSRLLLIIATFLGASFFGISWYAYYQLGSLQYIVSKILGWTLSVIGGIGLISSLLSMAFSIRAFGSRHTRGASIGTMISIEHWKRFFGKFFPILFGKEIYPPGSPIEEANLAREEKGLPMRRLTHLAFFQRHYGTYDPVLIRNQRMLDMRALNYEKIFPEVYARRLLLLGLVLMFICYVIIIILGLI